MENKNNVPEVLSYLLEKPGSDWITIYGAWLADKPVLDLLIGKDWKTVSSAVCAIVSTSHPDAAILWIEMALQKLSDRKIDRDNKRSFFMGLLLGSLKALNFTIQKELEKDRLDDRFGRFQESIKDYGQSNVQKVKTLLNQVVSDELSKHYYNDEIEKGYESAFSTEIKAIVNNIEIRSWPFYLIEIFLIPRKHTFLGMRINDQVNYAIFSSMRDARERSEILLSHFHEPVTMEDLS